MPIKPIRLFELNKEIKRVLESSFDSNTYWIIAEVTNHIFNQRTNYHNFELVEKDSNSNNIIAKAKGKAWGSGSRMIYNFEQSTGQKFTNNINVLFKSKVVFHEVYGLTLELIDIDTNFTLGALEQQKRLTLERLVNENDFITKIGEKYITRNSLLELPIVIQRIALIHSKSSAGGEDFKHSLTNNSNNYKFIIDEYDTVVQGEANAYKIKDRLLDVYKYNLNAFIKYDIVVVTRGGGAQSDFLVFDNYEIARTIAKFPIPIITGIGHQRNETIADLMANQQTKTPTKAAEFIIEHNKNFEDNLLRFQKNIIIKTQQLLSHQIQNITTTNSIILNTGRKIISENKDLLNKINHTLINTSKTIIFERKNNLVNVTSQILSKPTIILYNRINDIYNVISNIKSFKIIYLKNALGYLGHHSSIIKLMAPESLLKKGFAIIKLDNKIITGPEKINIGSNIDIIFSNSIINSTVNQKSKTNGTKFNI